MGIEDDRIGLFGSALERMLLSIRESGATVRLVENDDGKWVDDPALPPIGKSFIEVMPNGEVRKYLNTGAAFHQYQVLKGPIKGAKRRR